MHIMRRDDAPGYEAPGHHDMTMRYLQGRDAGPADTLWIGMSVIAPGGGTTLSASALEKFYVVIEGEVELTADAGQGLQTATLERLDSVRIAPGEARRLRNATDAPARVLLVMPHAPA